MCVREGRTRRRHAAIEREEEDEKTSESVAKPGSGKLPLEERQQLDQVLLKDT